MELTLANARQHKIADLLWIAVDEAEVAEIVRQYGKDAVVVREMMIAAAMDEITDTDMAADVINNILNG